jgi:hypothetical protein
VEEWARPNQQRGDKKQSANGYQVRFEFDRVLWVLADLDDLERGSAKYALTTQGASIGSLVKQGVAGGVQTRSGDRRFEGFSVKLCQMFAKYPSM